tara:strand:+ start:197313 stop:198662 length:1350 start_codon:yes stop_codon:yes gene_type:complete
MTLKKALFIAGLLVSGSAFAQNSNTLYMMENVFQNQFNNPAFEPISNISVNLISGSVEAGFSGFALGKFINTDGSDNSVEVDPRDVVDKLGKNNELVFKTDLTLLGFGFKVKSIAMQVSLRSRTNLSLNLPEDLLRLMVEGNGESFLDRPADLSNTSLNLTTYAELGVAGSVKVGNKLRVGARVKFLSGLANIHTEKSELTLTTDQENYGLRLQGAYTFRSSNVTDELDVTDFEGILNGDFKNTGIGLDFGFTYKLNDKMTVTGALLDLGAITWNQNTKSYENDSFDFEYKGEDIFDFADGNHTDEPDMLDSLSNAIKAVETEGSYTTGLPARLIASFEYKLNEKAYIGAVTASEYVPGLRKVRPNFTGFYRMQFGKTFGINFSNTIAYRSFLNPGIAMAAKLGFFQIFMSSDNILGVFSPESTRSASVAFGMNLAFGGSKGIKQVTAP